MIEATITSYYISSFKEELKAACKKMKVAYELVVGQKRVIGKMLTNVKDTNTLSNYVEIWGYDVEIIIPEIERMTETGYEYLGCIKDDGLVTVHPNDNADFDLSSMEELKTFPCDRCGKKTKRNIIHVFRKDGEVTVYGSGCAKTKFGIDVNVLIDKFSRIKDMFGISEIGEDGMFSGGSGWSFIQADTFCTLAYHEVVEQGYVSASKVYNEGYGLSTTDSVMADYFELVDGNTTVRKAYDYNLENIDFNFMKMLGWATAYVASLEEGDFKFNMKGALEVMLEGYVHPRTKGFVTYMTFKYWYDNVRVSEKKETVEFNTDYSEMEVKERLRDIKMVVINEYSFTGHYGTTTIYTLRGVDNNIKYKWFSSAGISEDIVGGELLVTGTVKAFEDDAKYGKAVVLTRCAVKEVV